MALRSKWLWAAGAAVVVAGGYLIAQANDDYELRLVMPSAASLLEGSAVEIGGERAGEVSQISTRDGKALVTVTIDDDDAPLRTGSKVEVEWRGLLGERVIALKPGPASNPEIPSGGMISAGTEQVELDQVLAALDPPTRSHLRSMVQQLDRNLKAHPDDMRETVAAAGPAVAALGEVLRAVGDDGPAIKNLIADLRDVMEAVGGSHNELRQVIGNLTAATDSMADHQAQLRRAIGEMPATLDAAKRTMNRVPSAVDATAPLLRDLRSATRQLTSVSRNLSPLLADLRPVMSELRPTLRSSSDLLRSTPQLLDSAHATLPSITRSAKQFNPAISFLRPYTPDLMGWLSNWGAAFANYDSQGHYWHALVALSPSAQNDNPGVSAGLTGGPNSRPAPGIATGKGWLDANGSAPR